MQMKRRLRGKLRMMGDCEAAAPSSSEGRGVFSRRIERDEREAMVTTSDDKESGEDGHRCRLGMDGVAGMPAARFQRHGPEVSAEARGRECDTILCDVRHRRWPSQKRCLMSGLISVSDAVMSRLWSQ